MNLGACCGRGVRFVGFGFRVKSGGQIVSVSGFGLRSGMYSVLASSCM